MDLQDPAGIRTAVSRCYYSALLSARAALEQSGEKIGADDNIHERIVDILSSRGPGGHGGRLADDLEDLNGLRTAADLDAGSSIGIEDLNTAHTMASMFNKDVGRHFRGDSRPSGRAR